MNGEVSADEPPAVAVGRRIKGLRKKRAMTQGELGRAVGVTAACICQWEAGRSFPGHKWFASLTRALNTSDIYLITGIGDPFADKGQIIDRGREYIAQALGVNVSRVRVDIQ